VKTWYHSWRAAIRIARRDAWRFKGRSFLVLAMIALPILGVSAMDLTIRTSELTASEKLDRDLGQADALFTDPQLGGVPLLQAPDGGQYAPAKDYDDMPWPQGKADLTKAFPAGSKVLTDTTGNGKLRTEHGLLNTRIHELKAADPMARGILRLTSGHFPRKTGEVAATTHFLETSGLRVGSKLTARSLDADYRIVGSYELPNDLKTDEVNALPGALLAPLDKALKADQLPGTDPSTVHLLTIPGHSFTWNMVQKANTYGVKVESRAVLMNPPARSDVPLYRKPGWNSGLGGGTDTTVLATAATIVGLAMLEICLLAGPAFAVGARRSRRQLGLVGANGGDRRHIRAIVLAGGLVIGIVSAVVGTVLGIGLTFALRPTLESVMGQRFGSYHFRPLELAGIAALAVLTGLLAAIVPAITASRQTVLASLTGRRGIRRSSRVLPVLGLIAFLLGAVIALYGSTLTNQFAIVAGGSAIAELGVVALTPALVGFFGRAGRWLPLSPRLALRDAVRNRGRTAPAVAAVLAAVAGTVAVATYAASDDAQSRAGYKPSLPYGAVSVMINEDSGRDVPAARSAIKTNLPVDVEADVDRIVVGKPNCSPSSMSDSACGRYELVVPKANQCPLWSDDSDPDGVDPADKFSKAERRKLSGDWRCATNDIYSGVDVAIGDTKLLKVLGINDPAAAKALAAGEIVTFDKKYVDHHSGNGSGSGKTGTASIKVIDDTEKEQQAHDAKKDYPGTVKQFTAHQIPAGQNPYGISALVSPATAKAAGFSTVPAGAFFSTTSLPTGAQEQRLNSELDKTGSQFELRIEKGYTSKNNIVLLALSVFAGLITIGAAGIATGLAQADAEADLKTLAAVGAPARVRRTLSGFQCGVVAVMGVVLGSVAGVLPAIGLRLTDRRHELQVYQDSLDNGSGGATLPHVPIVVPWETLAALLIAVPLGAALLAALVTRSRGSLARRAEA
jgi:putative ABC transport system permease protein